MLDFIGIELNQPVSISLCKKEVVGLNTKVVSLFTAHYLGIDNRNNEYIHLHPCVFICVIILSARSKSVSLGCVENFAGHMIQVIIGRRGIPLGSTCSNTLQQLQQQLTRCADVQCT